MNLPKRAEKSDGFMQAQEILKADLSADLGQYEGERFAFSLSRMGAGWQVLITNTQMPGWRDLAIKSLNGRGYDARAIDGAVSVFVSDAVITERTGVEVEVSDEKTAEKADANGGMTFGFAKRIAEITGGDNDNGAWG